MNARCSVRTAWTRLYARGGAPEKSFTEELYALNPQVKAVADKVAADYPKIKDANQRLLTILRTPRMGILVNAPGIWEPITMTGGGEVTALDSFDHNDKNWWCPFEPDRQLGGLRDDFDSMSPARSVPHGRRSSSSRSSRPMPWRRSPRSARACSRPIRWSRASAGKKSRRSARCRARPSFWRPRRPDGARRRARTMTAAAEALALAIKTTRYGCNWHGGHGAYSKAAYEVLHQKFGTTTWATQTPYWFDCVNFYSQTSTTGGKCPSPLAQAGDPALSGRMAEVKITFDAADDYERFMGRWSRAIGAKFLEWLDPPPDARWLDVGCGTGAFSELILRQWRPKSLAGADPSPEQIAHVRKLLPGSTFQVADSAAMPFSDGEFDVVASALVIHFIPDRAKAFMEMKRVLRAGGLVGGYTWKRTATTDCAAYNPMLEAVARVGGEPLRSAVVPEGSLEGMRASLALAGFADVAATEIEVSQTYESFDAYWTAQTFPFSPPGKSVAKLSDVQRAKLRDLLRETLAAADGTITYSATAVAGKARKPG